MIGFLVGLLTTGLVCGALMLRMYRGLRSLEGQLKEIPKRSRIFLDGEPVTVFQRHEDEDVPDLPVGVFRVESFTRQVNGPMSIDFIDELTWQATRRV